MMNAGQFKVGDNRKLTDAQEIRLVKQYVAGAECKYLGEAYGITPQTVRSILHIYDQPLRRRDYSALRRKLPLNQAAFSKVTPDSAYWTGFLMADGSIYKRNGNSAFINLELQIGDIDQVYKLKDFLGAGHKIGIRKPSTGVIKGYRFASAGTAYILVASDQLAKDLSSFGVVPRKSMRATVRKLQLNKHFWRGVVDGDGNIAVYNGQPRVCLYGSKQLLTQFLEFVKTIYRGEIHGKVARKPGTRIFNIMFTGDTARTIAKVLYTDALTYLDRKMDAAVEIMG